MLIDNKEKLTAFLTEQDNEIMDIRCRYNAIMSKKIKERSRSVAHSEKKQTTEVEKSIDTENPSQ